MSDDATPNQRGRLTTVFLVALMTFAVIGFMVGILDIVAKSEGSGAIMTAESQTHALSHSNDKIVPALLYADVPNQAMGPTEAFQAKLASLPKQTDYDLFKKIVPSDSDKAASAKTRASRRAFNGAPPIIPHATENTNDSACYACHSSGIQMAGMKASVMSHEFLANCTQCHALTPPTPFKDVDGSVDNSFVGLPAPKAGKRAYPGAPPTIPHSQWMRKNCSACHGGPNGWSGMESTHPWRTNCTQCHAPSASLDQAIPAKTVPMLPPIKVASD